MNDDATLLRLYAERRDEIAFRELVNRHIDLVYAASLRRTDGDNGGKNPPNEQALLPYFPSPKDGADFVEFLEAKKAAGL